MTRLTNECLSFESRGLLLWASEDREGWAQAEWVETRVAASL